MNEQTDTPKIGDISLDIALEFVDKSMSTGGLMTFAVLKTLGVGCRELIAAREELLDSQKKTLMAKAYKNTLKTENSHLKSKLIAVTEQRDIIDSMYHKVIKEVLDCDPIPACERDDGQLEPPWEVIARIRQQRDEARKLAERYRNLSCDSQDEADETLLPWETTNQNEL